MDFFTTLQRKIQQSDYQLVIIFFINFIVVIPL